MNETRLSVLLLCDYQANSAGTIIDHIEGIKKLSTHRVHCFPMMHDIHKSLALERYDVVLIHYSLILCMDSYVGEDARARLREFKGLKIVFVQDDYRWVNDTVNAIADIGVNVLFCLAPQSVIDEVYSPEKLPTVRCETVLAGYIPEHLVEMSVPELAGRKIDVGYRARRLSAWLGSHAREKWIIGEKFKKDARQYTLKTDISMREKDRLYGQKWIDFVANCKAVLGTESGSGVCDYSGEIQRNVEAHEKRDPSVSFETLKNLYFPNDDGRVLMNVISPRCFEAASLRTLMILYEGHYSGRLLPWEHYVPLERDHSNMRDVVAILKDPMRAQEMVDRAYEDVACNPRNSFREMVRFVDRVISEEMEKVCLAKDAPGSSVDIDVEFDKVLRRVERAARWRSVRRKIFMSPIAFVDLCLKVLPEERAKRIRTALQTIWRKYLRKDLTLLQALWAICRLPRQLSSDQFSTQSSEEESTASGGCASQERSG